MFSIYLPWRIGCGCHNHERGMEVAAVTTVAELAQAERSEVAVSVYGIENLSFGPEYLIPKPCDPRLITVIGPVVAKAAMDDGLLYVRLKISMHTAISCNNLCTTQVL